MAKINFGEIQELVLPKEAHPKASRPLRGYSSDENSFFSLYVLRAELEKIEEYLVETPKIESGGLLIGHPFVDIDNLTKTFTVVVGSIPVKSANSSIGHYTVSPEELSSARLKIPEGLMSVGWYHSHPGHGIFLSGADMTIMESIYSLDWQTAFVFDTFSGDKGFFHGKRGKKVTNVRYLDQKPGIIEAIARYNCAVSAKETGDAYVMESFKSWLHKNPIDDLLHWVKSGVYQDVRLSPVIFSSTSDLEWQKEFDKAVGYYKSEQLQSAQIVFKRLSEIKSDPTVLDYLTKIKYLLPKEYKKSKRSESD